MRKICRRIGVAIALIYLLPFTLAAAPKAEAIVLVADSRGYGGWRAWWTNLYNDSHFYFALFTVIFIPLLGVVLGLVADSVLSRIGINLRSRELAEH